MMTIDKPFWNTRLLSFSAVLALHALAIAGLVHYVAKPAKIEVAATPVMVSVITQPEMVKSQPEPPRPKTKPEPEPVKRIVTKTIDNTPLAYSLPTQPEPPAEAPPAPIQAPVTETPLAVTPPNFSAAYLDNPKPAYPALSRRTGEQGKVLLRVYVNAEGQPEKIELKNSSGSARLDAAAVETVHRWRFVPARQGTKPVSDWVLVPISFTLEG